MRIILVTMFIGFLMATTLSFGDDFIDESEKSSAQSGPITFDTESMDFPNIIIYTRPTCPFCNNAKSYLRSKGVPFLDKDVEYDHIAETEMKQIYKVKMPDKKVVVPLIVVGNKVLRGFNQTKLENTINMKMTEKNSNDSNGYP